MHKILAIIPARSGSKGLKDKNIKLLDKKPLLAYPILAALNCKDVNQVLLSTDSEIYAEIGKKFGADVPFLRPANLAKDNSKRSDVILDILNKCEGYDIIVYLEPTSPFTSSEDISAAIKLLTSLDNDAESVVGIAKNDTYHPKYAVTKEKGYLKPYLVENFNDIPMNRQDLDDVWFFDGSLYVSFVDSFKNHREFYHERTLGIELEEYKKVEIDSLFDFKIVKTILDEKNK
jgi:CMP-N,N'-diacetyllegionaminic acid synthase